MDVVSAPPVEDTASAAPPPVEDAANAAPAPVEDVVSAAPPAEDTASAAPPETADATEPPDTTETPDTTLAVASPDPLPTVNIIVPAYGGPPVEHDRDLIKRLMQRHNGAIRACYEDALKKDPTVKGQITVAWTINTKGEVEKPTAKTNTTKNADLEACIIKVVKKVRFPASDSPVQITYPFTFESP